MEGNEVRRLRNAITELSKVFDSEVELVFSKGDSAGVPFSYVVDRTEFFERKKFYEIVEDYGIDMTNHDQLVAAHKELSGLIKTFSSSVTELEKSKSSGTFEEVLKGMRDSLDTSTLMQSLPQDELEKRQKMLDIVTVQEIDDNGVEETVASRPETMKQVKAFLSRLKKECYAVREAKMLNERPEIFEIYEDLRDMEDELVAEQEYRDEHRTVTAKYNSLCTSYESLEMIEQELSDSRITDKRRSRLDDERKAIIQTLKDTMSPEVSGRLFGKDGKREPSNTKLMKALKEDIEDVAFQKNALNGLVDRDVLSRDVFIIAQVDRMQDIEDASKLTNAKERTEKIKELTKTKELEEFAKKIELKRMLQELNTLLAELAELTAAEARYNELKAKPEKDLTDDEKREMAQLLQKTVKLKNVKSRVGTLQNSIKELAKELHMETFEKMDLNFSQVIENFALKDVDRAIDGQKKSAQTRRNKVCAKYGIAKNETTENISVQMKAKIEDIQKRKRTNIPKDEVSTGNTVNSPNDTSVPGGTSPRTPGNAIPTPLNFGGRPAPVNIPHSSFGNPRYAGDVSVPNTNLGVNTNVSSNMPQSQETEIEENTVNAPIDSSLDPNSVENRLSYLMHKSGRVAETIEADDAELQINTIDPERRQRVENGIVYRYARGANPGELYFVEEGLEMYLENPQKKLESVLKGLRERMSEELGSEEQLEEYLDSDPKNELLRDLVSEDKGTSRDARKKIISKLDKMNKGNEDLAYVSMAIALNSEIEPEKIVEVLGRASQPYSRPCDMRKYVREEETKGFLGLGKKTHYVIEPTLLERNQKREEKRAERYKSSLNSKAQPDGMVRPFEISAEEKGQAPRKENTPQRENQDPNKRPQRRKPRNNSNPGDRD